MRSIEELERRGHRFVRYADDCNVYVRSKRAGERVMETLVGLYAKLKLQVNIDKSAVARVWDRQFLGFCFWVAPGRVIKRRVAPKALDKMKERVREITSRSGGRSLAQVVTLLRSYLVGWSSYFRLADTPQVFAQVEQWLHRRLRAIHLKHWKRGRPSFASYGGVASHSTSRRWRLDSPATGGGWRAMQPYILPCPHRISISLGCRACLTLTSTHRTAGCGPACPVVWEGSRGDILSYSLSRSPPCNPIPIRIFSPRGAPG